MVVQIGCVRNCVYFRICCNNKELINFTALTLISCVHSDKSLIRQPSTTEYLPGMLHAASPAGLLPQFPSWSLVCLGPSSLYSHNLGLQDQQQAGLLGGSAYLLPWDVTVRLEHHRYCAMSVMCWSKCYQAVLNILPVWQFMWSSIIIFHLFCVLKERKWPLWSSGQSSWLQIQRPGFDSRRYQILWEVVGLERGPLSLVSTIEELLGRKSSCFCLENREYACLDPLCWPRGTLYPQKLALISPRSCCLSIGIVRSWAQTMEFVKERKKTCEIVILSVCVPVSVLPSQVCVSWLIFTEFGMGLYALRDCLIYKLLSFQQSIITIWYLYVFIWLLSRERLHDAKNCGLW
jgi:hypothetical protein